MSAHRKATLAATCLAFSLTAFPAGAAQAATWTFTPELKRLDAEGRELPAGPVEVARHQVLRVGLYIAVTTDGEAPATDADAHLGFESFGGAIHFTSAELDAKDIGLVLRSLRGGQGWQRRMDNASFDPVDDSWLGPPEESDNETSWIAFWSDPTNTRASPRGAWCASESGTCRIFLGVLTISVAHLPTDAVGDLSLRFGGVTSAEESATVGAIFGRAVENVESGNSITYNICLASGCAVADDSVEPDRESRALAMKLALASFGREVGGNVVAMIGERADMNAGGIAETYLALGGRQMDVAGFRFGRDETDGNYGWLSSVTELLGINLNSQDGLAWEAARATGVSSGHLNLDLLPSARDLLTGSSFEVGFGGDDHASGKWTLWGLGGDMNAFGGSPDDHFSMNGEVFAGHIGLDYRLSEALLAGVIVSRTTGRADYRFSGHNGDDGGIEMQLTSAHPYVHWIPLQGLGVWGSLGFGRGGATLIDERGSAETAIGLQMTALGVRRDLMPIGRFDLAIKADAFFVIMESDEHTQLPATTADSSRMRLALESSRSFAFEGGSVLTGKLELGALSDSGDAETGAGAELGAALAYQHPGGIDIQANGHVLLAHEESEFEQWGASLTVAFDWGLPNEGLFFALMPAWGAPARGAEGMWETTRLAEGFVAGESEQGMNLDTRVGYGLRLPNRRGRLTLFGEMGKFHAGPPRLRLGTQLARTDTPQSAMNFEIVGERIGAGPNEEPAYGIVINARGGF